MSNPATPAADHGEYADIVVVIGHPFGDVECPLTQWMAVGPGRRPLLRPSRDR